MGATAGLALLSGTAITGATESFNNMTKKMKIVMLTGSPRRNGNTNHLAGQFMKGAEEAGHDVYKFDCAWAKVSPCTACNSCGMGGECVFNDDFTTLRPYLVDADMVVFAAPMYYFGFSSQLKRVIDRFYALNYDLKGADKKAVLLMAYADTAAKEAEPMLSHYRTLLDYLGWSDAGTVVAPGMWPAGAVKNSKYSRMAYELGKNIN